MKIAILGAGAMGTTMAEVAARNNHNVFLWNWEGDLTPLRQIDKWRENKKYLPGFLLHKGIIPEKSLESTLMGAQVVCFAVPTAVIASIFTSCKPFIDKKSILVDMAKGLDGKTSRPITTIMGKVFPKNPLVVMSGPAVALDIMKGYYTQMDLASQKRKAAKTVQEIFSSSTMGFDLRDDVVGVELAGAFKNVYAIALGLCDGLGYGLNTKAAFLTHAMEEMACVVEAFGGKRKTVYGLSGFGDLIGTALSDNSRNRCFGEYLGRGLSVEKALKKVGKVVEGKSATFALISFAKKKNKNVPLANMVSSILSGEVSARCALETYLQSHF
ncbi:MAG: hypothetical protein COV59_04350 [Candidatus Magasanikbacteria bacterium CG11_big_fil_rev_8_21_14_0_20_39_34]|uniref:Glycerol-3-phosphate dehydrogenase [NAD(P)+] n=1 Tax=Candidatus Magasanikbacteria bacterium CG11_big_fil_rev_8_21_14_0_20_39_34 TaxID=1974653 RepID=A0A2H0N4N8_9BACT|nr:MAG: hypothetical protein COV59_04350 [Candidatus Magasanikbacteria bacterium CG11_big_fil_rev_8_21_14_0_20_39_34]